MEVIVFPDAEEAFRAHLEDELPAYGSDTPAHCSVPTPRPETFVLVRRVGGPRSSLVTDTPSLSFECWAPLPSEALALANLVRGIVSATAGQTVQGVRVYSVTEFAGPAFLPDPDSKTPRYTFTAGIKVRGTAQERED